MVAGGGVMETLFMVEGGGPGDSLRGKRGVEILVQKRSNLEREESPRPPPPPPGVVLVNLFLSTSPINFKSL